MYDYKFNLLIITVLILPYIKYGMQCNLYATNLKVKKECRLLILFSIH